VVSRDEEKETEIMHVAQNWRLRGTRYAMNAERCENCGNVLFPSRVACPHCVAVSATSHQERYTFDTVSTREYATIADASSHGEFELRQAAR
jgi:uncharacterized OB-fold protein